MFEFSDFIYYLILALIMAMGILVALNGWRLLNNKIFFLVALGSIAWVVSLHEAWVYVDKYDWNRALSLMRLSYGFSLLGTTLMTIFIYFFPSPNISINRYVKILYLAFSLSLFCLASFTPLINKSLIIENNIYIGDGFGPLQSAYIFSILLNIFAAAYLSIKKYSHSVGLNKKKMTLVLSGYFCFAVIAILTNVVLPLFNIYLIQNYSQFLIIVFLIPTFFALQRYRFFNFSNVSLNFLRKIITYSVYLAVAIFSYIFLSRYTNPGIFLGLLSSIIAIVFFKLAEKYIPLLETSSLKHFKRTLTDFKSKIYYCNTYRELEKLIEEVFIIELNYINAKVFVVRKKIDDIGLNIYKENVLTNTLRKYSKDLLIKDEVDFKKLDELARKVLKSEMDKLNADLSIPLFSEKNLIGFFILKKKNSDSPYISEILNELLLMKKDLEIGLMNVLLKMNLQEENNLMKNIIDEKTKELKNKITQINEMLRQQSDFIAVTAHEFRTPLSIASFQLEDLLSNSGNLNKKIGELKVIDDSISNLKQLTEKLFAIQQYDLNKVALNLKKVELREFLKKIHQEFLPIMKEKNLKFDLKIQIRKKVFAKIDKVQMRQVLHNLLKNASKFTSEYGRILLKLDEERGNAIISVEDNGEGIPDNLKKSIFEKFRTKSSGAGIGLGLYLCKKTIELHKGKIWVEDNLERGASFRISLKKVTK